MDDFGRSNAKSEEKDDFTTGTRRTSRQPRRVPAAHCRTETGRLPARGTRQGIRAHPPHRAPAAFLAGLRGLAGPGPAERQLGAGSGDPADGLRGLSPLSAGGHRPAEPPPARRGDRRERVLLHPPRRRNGVPAPGGGQLPGPVLRAARGSAVSARRRIRRHRHHGVPARDGAGGAARGLGRPRGQLCGRPHGSARPGEPGSDAAGRLFGQPGAGPRGQLGDGGRRLRPARAPRLGAVANRHRAALQGGAAGDAGPPPDGRSAPDLHAADPARQAPDARQGPEPRRRRPVPVRRARPSWGHFDTDTPAIEAETVQPGLKVPRFGSGYLGQFTQSRGSCAGAGCARSWQQAAIASCRRSAVS